MDPTPYNTAKIKKIAILLFVVVAGILLIHELASISFITVSSDSAEPQNITITKHGDPYKQHLGLNFQSTGKLNRRVSSGDYDVLVTQGDKSFLASVKARGFFRTTPIQATLKPEISRSYVGNNPASCMSMVENVMLSYVCAGDFTNINEHIPATSTVPTYVTHTALQFDRNIQGIVQTPSGPYALIYTIGSSGDEGNPRAAAYTLEKIHSDLSTSNVINLPDLSTKDVYSIAPYNRGFLVYLHDFSQIYYYASVSARPSKIPVKTLPKLTPIGLSVHGQGIALAYSSNPGGDGSAINKGAGSAAQTDVIVYKNGESKEYNFNEQYNSVQLCGEQRLCLANNKLYVFDVSGVKARHVFDIEGVTDLADYGNGLLAIRKDGILNVDIDRQTASFNYTLGSYQFCGVQPADNGFISCIRDTNGNTAALLFNQNVTNTDSIDKKVATLIKTPEISLVSIYGNYITVTTRGPVVLDTKTGFYGPDPEIQKGIDEDVNKAINAAGIDTSKYSVTTVFGS